MERRFVEGWRSRLDRSVSEGLNWVRGRGDVAGYSDAREGGQKARQDAFTFVTVPVQPGDTIPVFTRRNPALYQRYLLDWAVRHSGQDFETYEDAVPWLKERRLLSRREYWASLPKPIKAERIARMVEYNRLYRLRNRKKVAVWARKSRQAMSPEDRSAHLQMRREKRLDSITDEDRFRDLCYQQLLRLAGLSHSQNLSAEQVEQRRIYAQLVAIGKRLGCI